MQKIRNSIFIVLFFLSCQNNQEKIYYKFPKAVQDELDSICTYSTVSKIIVYDYENEDQIQIFFSNRYNLSHKKITSLTNRFVKINNKDLPLFYSYDIKYGNENIKKVIFHEEMNDSCSLNISFNDQNDITRFFFGTGNCFYFNRPWIEKGVQSDFIPPSSN